MASEIVTLPIQSITLNFHLSCWQNRRARIYLDGVSLDQFHETLDVAAFAKHLVLSGKNLIPLPLGDVNGRSSLFFHHDEMTENVLELQVWHVENGRRCLFEEFGPRHDNDPSMRLERISTAKNRFYITLDCEKRLKVQRLVLVAVLRIEGKLYVSEDAHFPPPSSKRGASPRIKGRTGPYEMLLSFAEHGGDDERHSPRNGATASPPGSGRRRASSLKSTSSVTSSPRSGSSAEVTSWQTLGKWLLESLAPHLPGAHVLQHLSQLSSIAIDFGSFAISSSPSPSASPSTPTSGTAPGTPVAQPPLPTVESIRDELLTWLQSGPYHIMELLEAGILDQCVQEPWFLGNISEAGSQAYLHWYRQRANLRSAFLVRFSSPHSTFAHPANLPHLVLDATWTNEQSGSPVLERYSATVLYEFDQFGQLYFWIDTSNDAGPSRSNSLSEVVRYICNTTGWPHVWRNSPVAPSAMPFSGASYSAQQPNMNMSPFMQQNSYQVPKTQAPQNGVSPMHLPTSPVDAISSSKHRSMPLLHTPPGMRLRASVGSTSSPMYASGALSPSSGNQLSGSPMLIIPSKIGILPHDPATTHGHMSVDSQAHDSAANVASGLWNTPTLPYNTMTAPNTTTLPNMTHMQMRAEQMDTGSSESASFDIKSASGSNLPDTDAGSTALMDQSDSSISDLAHQTNDLDFPTDSSNHHLSSHEILPPHSVLPPLGFQDGYGAYSDSIGGTRSLSAPTALRWSGSSNSVQRSLQHTPRAAQPTNSHPPQNSQNFQTSLESPNTYFMPNQQAPQQGGFYFSPSTLQSDHDIGAAGFGAHELTANGASFTYQEPNNEHAFRFSNALDFNTRSHPTSNHHQGYTMNGTTP